MSKGVAEYTLDTVLFRLQTAQREVAYHRAVMDAAEAGFEDCLDVFSDKEGLDIGPVPSSHVRTWARRLYLSSTSLIEALKGQALDASLVEELLAPPVEEGDKN